MVAIGDVILAIGTSRFYGYLFDFLRADLPVRQLIVHRYIGERGVDILAVETQDGGEHPEPFIELYRHHFLHRDPLRSVLQPSSFPQFCVKSVDSGAIKDADYRNRLFSSAGFSGKLSIIERMPNDVLAISLYRDVRAGSFSGHDINFAMIQQPVLAAALRRHTQSTPPLIPDIDVLKERLMTAPAARRLSEREAAVCARIVLGYSNEAISLALDLSIHSITTYRRRAYQKFGITSQNELFAIVLKTQEDVAARQLAPWACCA